jgi:ornithine cyclodeaminase/alanine dehydrogenase-like protein (mu-crystallin family)
VIEADALEQLRAGAASALAARHLAREGATTLGVVGCGRAAAAQVACIRQALPGITEVVVAGRDPRRLAAFCRAHRCTAAASNREAAEQEIVVTATRSHDPVLRGEWLREGVLVIALGANDPADRELDNTAIERASFVCCASREQSRREAGDLIDPVSQGVLEWLEVHELHELVCGELEGRASADDLVLFKSNPLAAWDIALGARALELAQA